MFSIVLFLQYIQHNGHMIKLFNDSLSTVEPEGKYLAVTVLSLYICMYARSLCPDNIFPSSPPSQSIGTYTALCVIISFILSRVQFFMKPVQMH